MTQYSRISVLAHSIATDSDVSIQSAILARRIWLGAGFKKRFGGEIHHIKYILYILSMLTLASLIVLCCSLAFPTLATFPEAVDASTARIYEIVSSFFFFQVAVPVKLFW